MAKFIFGGKEYTKIEDYMAAVAAAEVETERLRKENETLKAGKAPSGPVHVSVKNGKLAVFFTDSTLAYQGRAFEHFGAPMAALIAAWPEIEAAYNRDKAKLVPTWEAYAEMPIGATLPDGSSKPAPKPIGRK